MRQHDWWAFARALFAVEWRRQKGKVGTWETTVVTQARDDAGSSQGGGHEKGEKQGYDVGVRVMVKERS